MTGIRRDQRSLDAEALDLYPCCPRCANVCPPGATVCECGGRLVPQLVPKAPPRRLPHGCNCDGLGICQACVLDEYDTGKAA